MVPVPDAFVAVVKRKLRVRENSSEIWPLVSGLSPFSCKECSVVAQAERNSSTMDRLATAVVRVIFIDPSLEETRVGVDNDGAVHPIRRRVRERFSFEDGQISPDKSPERCAAGIARFGTNVPDY